MTTRVRDYKAEYQRRLARAKERKIPKDVARGHPRKGRAGIKLAKVLGIKPGAKIRSRPKQAPAAPGFPTFEERLTAAGFRDFLKEARAEYLRRLPRKSRPKKDEIPYLVTSQEDFVQVVFEAKHSEREAYTAWFSP